MLTRTARKSAPWRVEIIHRMCDLADNYLEVRLTAADSRGCLKR